MAHNLANVTGRTEMAYYGETPWHKLGTKVDQAMTAAEAIEASGLNWTVEKRQAHFFDGGVSFPIPDKFATVRTDANVALGVVGSRYHILQNKESFSFFDAIVGEKLACYHTVGALGQGEKIWLLAKLPSEFWITADDKVEKYLLLTNSHDGSSAVQIMATPIRVVCQNTLNMALAHGSERSRVRHTLSMGMGINAIRQQIGIADRHFQLFEEVGKHLASKQASSEIVDSLFKELGLTLEKAEDSTRTRNIRDEIERLYRYGKGNQLPGVKGTAWALLNGVVEYVDYTRTAKGKNTEASLQSRANSLLFGSGADMKQQAMDTLLTLTK